MYFHLHALFIVLISSLHKDFFSFCVCGGVCFKVGLFSCIESMPSLRDEPSLQNLYINKADMYLQNVLPTHHNA